MRLRAKQFGLIVAYLLVCSTALSRVVDEIFDPPRQAYGLAVDCTRMPPKVLTSVPLDLEEPKGPLAERLVEWVVPLPLEVFQAIAGRSPTMLFHPSEVLKQRWSDQPAFGSGPMQAYQEQVWRVDPFRFAWQLALIAAFAAIVLFASTRLLRKLLRKTPTRGFEVNIA